MLELGGIVEQTIVAQTAKPSVDDKCVVIETALKFFLLTFYLLCVFPVEGEFLRETKRSTETARPRTMAKIEPRSRWRD